MQHPYYDWAKEKYEPLGYCMYCRKTNNLTKEHILPYALSLDGEVIFPKSSCTTCAEITSKFERRILRGPLAEVRAIKNLKSKSIFLNKFSKKDITIIIDGNPRVLKNVPQKHRPIVIAYPVFQVPGYILKQEVNGINVKGLAVIDHGTQNYQLIRKLASIDEKKEIRFQSDTQSYDFIAFAKLISKIAYGHAVAKREINPLERIPKIVDYILGKEKNIGRLVGTVTDPLRSNIGLLHKVTTQHKDGIMLGYVKLFANSYSPEYGVILDYSDS